MNDIPPVKPGYLGKVDKSKKEKTAIVMYDQERMKKNISLGTSGIDPADVLPSQVKLVQGSTDFSKVVDDAGKQATVGQYFFLGDKTIHESVKGYVLSMAKVNDPFNLNKDGTYERMYRMVGVFDDLKTPFTMNFRRGAMTTVKNLIGNIFSQKRGIYTFKIEIASEQKKGLKGNYLIPLIKIIENVEDPVTLDLLERGAIKYEYLTRIMGDEDLVATKRPAALPGPVVETIDKSQPTGEDINPDDIPF